MQYLWMFLTGAVAFINGRGLIWTIAAYLLGHLLYFPYYSCQRKKKGRRLEKKFKEFARKVLLRMS
jgi:hypothetical protein